MIKVSVIVPVYNCENTIERCIDSILNQTLENIEIIVVNDGSTDKTWDILKKYKEKAKLISQKRNGQGYARNIGIEISSGEYVGFIDADDSIEPNMYEKMYLSAKKYNSDVVQCGIRDIREDGSIHIRTVSDSVVRIDNKADYAFDYFYHGKHTNEVCNKLFKKEFLLQNDLAFGDTRSYFSEDFKLNMDILAYLNTISFVGDAFYNYYIKSGSHSMSDLTGRIPKMLNLFNDVLATQTDIGIKKTIECVAAVTILSYCADVADTSQKLVCDVLKDSKLRNYLKTSMTYKSNIKHFALIFALLFSPYKIKLFLVKKYYNF